MKKSKRFVLCCSLLAWHIPSLYAQQGTSASGGEAEGNGGSASYTIGIIDYTTATGSGGKVSQGLQQVYEIKVISGSDKSGITLSASVYPNPLIDFVKLKIESNTIENLTYQLCDALGNILINKKVAGNETYITMSEFADAVYFVKVLDKSAELKTFKIIKIQ